jgi:hypothetical protein
MRSNDNKKEEKREKLGVPFISARGIYDKNFSLLG